MTFSFFFPGSANSLLAIENVFLLQHPYYLDKNLSSIIDVPESELASIEL
jgi:hypothetical protein